MNKKRHRSLNSIRDDLRSLYSYQLRNLLLKGGFGMSVRQYIAVRGELARRGEVLP